MLEWFQGLFPSLNSSSNILLMMGVGLGTMFFVYGAFDALRPANPAARRYSKGGVAARRSRFDAGILYNPEVDPKGLMKALMPRDRKERTSLHRKLMNAGFVREGAIAKFTMWRVGLALGLPLIPILVIVLRQSGIVWLPGPLIWFADTVSRAALVQIVAVLAGIGFFLPSIWLHRKTVERVREIEEGLPNTLDLLQISIEAGMGFDAAMTRVANEMVRSAPAISQEFRIAQLEIAAGSERDKALLDMAERCGVDEVSSFANVVVQSSRFGTSMSDALAIYAQEMRMTRELRATEQANKLPVKMSAVMSSLMLPAMILIIVGPVAIRWMNTFGPGGPIGG